MNAMTDAGLLKDYEANAAALPGAGSGWVDGLRKGGVHRFEGLGLPTRRVEEWKYTDLRTLVSDPFGPADAASDDVSVPDMDLGAEPYRAVFVNGHFHAGLSDLSGLPDGVVALPLAQAMQDSAAFLESYLGRIATLGRRHFVALNTAWLADGFALYVPDGMTIERPIELVFIGATGDTRAAWHPRNLFVLHPGAQATIVERHIGETGTYLANTVAEIVLATGSRLNHFKLQDEAPDAFHVATTQIHASADAIYENFSLMTGSSVARNQIAIELQASGSSCMLNGAYLGRGKQQLDTTTLIDHAAPDCKSSEIYKGALDERSKGVFQGRIVVRKDAQRTNGHQSNKTLLLSDKAEVDAKPELEIYADDVVCSHGATVGELDEHALFYLRARGIPLEEARGLLIDAFVDGAIDEISNAAIREAFRSHAKAWQGGNS